MKKRFLNNFNIELATLLLILIGIYFDSLEYLVIFYFLAFIHELGHFIVAKFFKADIESFSFHPLGFTLKVRNIQFLPAYKQLLIYIAGPLMFFVNEGIIDLMRNINLLSIYKTSIAHSDNLSLLLFNLIPFYPLDGGRIMEVFLLKFFPSKRAFNIRIIISSIISIYLIILCLEQMQILLLIFIAIQVVSSIIYKNKEYQDYLISRIDKVNSYPLKINIKNRIDHFYHNYFISRNKIIPEEESILKNELKKSLIKK